MGKFNFTQHITMDSEGVVTQFCLQESHLYGEILLLCYVAVKILHIWSWKQCRVCF